MSPTDLPTVCLLGSPRRDCNSDTLAARFAQQAVRYGAPTSTFALSELSCNGCENLFRCKTDLDHCGQTDDLTRVLAAVSRAQVLVLASPVYFTSVTGQLKLAIDRFFSFFVPDYPTADIKSRLTSGRHLVFLQTQGEPEDRYAGLMESFSASFKGLGFDQHHLVRAWSVRHPGDINANSDVLRECDTIALQIYGSSRRNQGKAEVTEAAIRATTTAMPFMSDRQTKSDNDPGERCRKL